MLKTVSGRGYRLLGSWIPQQREATARRSIHPLPAHPERPNIGRDGRTAARNLSETSSLPIGVVTLTGPVAIGKTSLAIKAVVPSPRLEDGVDRQLASLSDPGLVRPWLPARSGLKLAGEIIRRSPSLRRWRSGCAGKG